MHWLEETLRKSPWNGPTSKSGPGVRVKLPDRREAAFRSIGHFPQVRAGVPLTRSAESSLPDRMAPHVGLEPSTIRLTAEPIVGLGPFILENSVLGTQFARYSAISAPACR